MIQDGKLTDEEAAARLDAALGGLSGGMAAKPEASRWTDDEAAARLDALIPKKPGLLDAFAGQLLEGGANLAGQGRILSEKLNSALGSDKKSMIFAPIEEGLRGAAESVYPSAQRGQGGLAEDVVGTLGGMIPPVASGIIGGPLAGAAAFGAQEGVPLYYSIKAKTGDEEAAMWGLLAGNAIGQLEQFGAEKALSGIVKKIAGKSGLAKGLADEATKYVIGLGGLTEAGTEVIQTGLSDLVYETLSKDDIDNWENIKRSIPPSLILGEGFHILDAAIQAKRPQVEEQQGVTSTQPPLPAAPGPAEVASMSVPIEPTGDLAAPAPAPAPQGIVLPQQPQQPAEGGLRPDVPAPQGGAEPVAQQALTTDGINQPTPEAFIPPPAEAQPATPPQLAQETGTAQVEPQAAQAPAVAAPQGLTAEVRPDTPTEPVSAAEELPATGIKNRTVEAELEKMGLEPPKGPERQSFVDLHAKAMATLKADPHAGSKLVDDLTKSKRTPSGEEAALLSLENNRLIVEREAAEEAFLANPSAETKARVETAKTEYGKAADAFKLAGTEAGISLAARKMMVARDYSLAAMERSLQVAKNGKPLTEQESKKIGDLHRRMVAAEKALAEHEKGAAAKVAGLEAKIAALEAKAEAAPKTPRNARKIASIAESKKRINEILNQLGGQQKAAAGLDVEKVKLVGELAYHGVKLGYNSFSVWADDMVARAGEHIRPYLRPAWDEAMSKSDAELLKRYKSRKKGDIKRLKERGEAGAFEESKRRTPIEKDEEAVHLKVEYEKARREFERLKSKAIEATKTRGEKAAGLAKEVLFDVERAIFSMLDFSAVMRQGGPLTKAHPLRAVKNARKMLRAFASEDAAVAVDLELRDPKINKHYELGEAAGLDLPSGNETGAEGELYRKAITDRIPGVKPSNRAYNAYISLQRAEAFGKLIDSLGHEPSMEEAKAIVDTIHVLTGRASGRGKAFADGLAKIPLFYAPSYVVSRFQVLGRPLTMLGDKRLSWKAKREIGKVYARWIRGQAIYYALTRGAVVAGIAAMSGTDDDDIDIETDLTSSDALKIKIGRTRWDVLGGIGQVGVFLARMATGKSKSTKSGNVSDFDNPRGPYSATYGSVLLRFLRSKSSPLMSRVIDAKTGETFSGEKVTPTEALTRLPQLGALNDAYEAMRELGIPSGAILGLFAMLGDSIMVYDDTEKASK